MSSAPSAAVPAPDREAESHLLAKIEPLRRGGRTLEVDPPDEVEEQAYQAWVAAAARAAQGGKTPPGAPPGFMIEELIGEGIWLLSERERRRGAGALLLRTGVAAPLLVEAPHTFFDQGTLPIATAVFVAQQARALLISTAHRYGGRPRPDVADEEAQGEGGDQAGRKAGPPPVSDVAHTDRSFFLAAHRALLDVFPGARTAQLHGYSDSSAPGVAAIASAVGAGADLGKLLSALRAALPDDALRGYPSEIRKLGGESNVQARWSTRVGAPFYHIEMSRTLRDRLVGDAALRRRFAAAFAPLTVAPPP